MTSKEIVVDLTSDNEESDEDLRRAIALSLQEHCASPQPSADDEETRKLTAGHIQPQSSLLGLDRKRMEQERLERLKRKRDHMDDPQFIPDNAFEKSQSRSDAKRTRVDGSSPILSHSVEKSRCKGDNERVKVVPASSKVDINHIRFPKGCVLYTSSATRLSSNTGQIEAICFSDLVRSPGSSILQSCFLSSFVADFDWLLPHFDTRKVNFVINLHASSPQHRRLLEEDFNGITNVKLVLPPSAGATMHSKLMLLFYKPTDKALVNRPGHTFCRLIVPSANLVPHDWGIGDVMENVMYVIDLPHVERPGRGSSFQTALLHQLSALCVPSQVIEKVTNLDFAAVDGVRLVHSIGGTHPQKADTDVYSSSATALLSLRDAVRSLGLTLNQDEESYPPTLDYITSSLGNLDSAFLVGLHGAVCGRDLGGQVQWSSVLDVKDHLNIYFPSHETVASSTGGRDAAGTICFQPKWWSAERSEFPKSCLRDCVAVREDGMLMHSKILYVRFKRPKVVKDADGKARTCAGWAYVGSANMSESAWGRVSRPKRGGQDAKLICRNWETGVVIPVYAQDEVGNRNKTDENLAKVFAASVPVPVRLPAPRLVDSGCRPWFFTD